MWFLKNILENYFDVILDEKQLFNIEDYQYSPAYIKQLCNKYSINDSDEAIYLILQELNNTLK